MPTTSRATQVAQAVFNNAYWCQAICRTHGIPGEFRDQIWFNRHPTPRFYPNAVTLSATSGATAQISIIRSMMSATTLHSFAVKDSYATLDLNLFDFQLFFNASWIWRSTTKPEPRSAQTELEWKLIQTPTALLQWEAAWNGIEDESISPQMPAIFLPALLADQTIRFIAGYQDQKIIAGAIANQSGDVVGISNVFAPKEIISTCWLECMIVAMDAFPGLALVGYERGDDLAIARELGFTEIGPLRVWGYTAPTVQ